MNFETFTIYRLHIGNKKKLQKNFFWLKKSSKKCILNFFMTEISLHLGVPDNQISLHFRVPDNQISLHFGVPDNQISLHFKVPDNCSLKSSGGVRQSRSLANGSTPQTEEH